MHWWHDVFMPVYSILQLVVWLGLDKKSPGKLSWKNLATENNNHFSFSAIACLLGWGTLQKHFRGRRNDVLNSWTSKTVSFTQWCHHYLLMKEKRQWSETEQSFSTSCPKHQKEMKKIDIKQNVANLKPVSQIFPAGGCEAITNYVRKTTKIIIKRSKKIPVTPFLNCQKLITEGWGGLNWFYARGSTAINLTESKASR